LVSSWSYFFYALYGFYQLKGIKHAYQLIRGDYDKPGDEGEVSHFQALVTALSGTVGLGNIAGVAVAISIGGAGATFWMILAGFLGMSSKFVECTLGVKYRN
jgi:alanine or glycine:cation symporter, AGCS family